MTTGLQKLASLMSIGSLLGTSGGASPYHDNGSRPNKRMNRKKKHKMKITKASRRRNRR